LLRNRLKGSDSYRWRTSSDSRGECELNFNHRLISLTKWELQDSNTFDWDIARRIDFFDPIGLTFLAGLIEKQLSKSDSGSITFNADIMNYLERINFLEYLESHFEKRLTQNIDRRFRILICLFENRWIYF